MFHLHVKLLMKHSEFSYINFSDISIHSFILHFSLHSIKEYQDDRTLTFCQTIIIQIHLNTLILTVADKIKNQLIEVRLAYTMKEVVLTVAVTDVTVTDTLIENTLRSLCFAETMLILN